MARKKRATRKKKTVVRSAWGRRLARFVKSPAGKVFLALMLITGVAGLVTVNHYYWKFAKLIDAKLAEGPFNRTSRILAAPDPIFTGDEITLEKIVSYLRNAGYTESRHNRVGHYRLAPDHIEVYPGPQSYFAQEPAVIYAPAGKVTRIVSLNDNTPQTAYALEPELITNLFDLQRSKRQLVRYEMLPEVLTHAVLAIEDHRFYDHFGFDVVRTAKAAWDGIVEGRTPRGTSTLTQQLARGFFLTPERTYTRKLAELLIALQLEARLSKEKILEYYCNLVPLGRRGSFNVMGMGEAADVYFEKDVRELTLPEAALLAGLIQRPSYLNPYRHPERALDRRNTVLRAMLREGFITEQEFDGAVQAPLGVSVGNIEISDAPYFVDLVNNRLQDWFPREELITENYWVYTTLDANLQRIAVEAVRNGMAEVDKRVARQRRFRNMEDPPKPQVALVALDPKTGEVKALVGGRNYGLSQLNRALAKRQPGSTFKPFVYAAAIQTALDGEGEVLTPVSTVDDVPTTFWWDDKPYEPSNFANKIHGVTTLRYALAKSINIATVKVAERAGFERVAEIARLVNMGHNIEPTPSIALGSYEATPLDIAGAYTALANYGTRMDPYFVREVRDAQGHTLLHNEPEPEEVLDPRVAYVVVHMLEDVVRRGTAVRVRAMGFDEPAVGKTGTDDDGWFAGFTSNLLCVVWVGFDDNTDLSIEGSKSALPIWTEFMIEAHKLREYRNPEPFEPVEGIVTARVDPITHELATHSCPETQEEVFIAGSQPSRYCRLHGGRQMDVLLSTNVGGWDNSPSSAEEEEEAPEAETEEKGAITIANHPALNEPIAERETPEDKPERKEKKGKKGFFGRVLDIFR